MTQRLGDATETGLANVTMLMDVSETCNSFFFIGVAKAQTGTEIGGGGGIGLALTSEGGAARNKVPCRILELVRRLDRAVVARHACLSIGRCQLCDGVHIKAMKVNVGKVLDQRSMFWVVYTTLVVVSVFRCLALTETAVCMKIQDKQDGDEALQIQTTLFTLESFVFSKDRSIVSTLREAMVPTFPVTRNNPSTQHPALHSKGNLTTFNKSIAKDISCTSSTEYLATPCAR